MLVNGVTVGELSGPGVDTPSQRGFPGNKPLYKRPTTQTVISRMATADHFTNGLIDDSGAKAFDLRL